MEAIKSNQRATADKWIASKWTKVRRVSTRSGVLGQVLSLAIVLGLFTIGTRGKFLELGNLQVILTLSAIPAIIAIGLHQVVVLGGIDLSIEGVIALCVVITGIFLGNESNARVIGLWILPIIVCCGGVAGLVNGLLNTKLRIPSFISSLGLSWILWGFAVYISKGAAIPILQNRLRAVVAGNVLGVSDLAIIAVVVSVVLQIVQDHTGFARHVYAIGGDETLAKQAGVKVDLIKIVVFSIAGALYGLAALFLAIRLESSQAVSGNNLLFPAVTAVSVGGVALTGGIGGAKNAALGAVIVTALNDGLILLHVNPYVQYAVNGVVLIVAVALTIDRKKLGFIK